MQTIMERAFQCDSCSEKFISRSKLNYPLSQEHGHPCFLAKKKFECNVCGKEFSTKQNMTAHMRVHTGERGFKCTVTDCGMAFKQIDALETHLRIHTGERPFKCTKGDCEMKFRHKSTLNSHIKFKHSDERPFKCNLPGCKYVAKSSSNLGRHMKGHSDDRPIACPNEGCNFRTKQKSNLTTHLTTVHSTAKEFPCSECEYRTTRKGDLKKHAHRRHSIGKDNTKCNHSECAEYLICSYDLECLLSNQDEASSTHCDTSGREQRLADANALCEINKDVYSEPSVVHPNLNYASYSTSSAEDFHASEAENTENIEAKEIQTLRGLSMDLECSCAPDVRPGRDGNEHAFFHPGFNWLDILQSSSFLSHR